MNKLLILVFILPLLALFAHSQEGSYIDYDWEINPSVYTPESTDLQENTITIFEKRIHEYVLELGRYVRYELLHTKKHLLTDQAIEQENKFYIWTLGSLDLYKLKARVIQPSGKVVMFNPGNLIESRDENGQIRYRYFVLEGIEKGSSIEYLHYMKFDSQFDYWQVAAADYFFDINDNSVKKQIDITVLLPNELYFHSYSNYLYDFQRAPSDAIQKYHFSAKNICKIVQESHSRSSESLHHLFYRIDKQQGYSPYVSYSPPSKEPYFFVGKKFDKMIGNLVTNNVTILDTTPYQKLRTFELFLKTHYKYVENGSTAWKVINKTKTLDERAIAIYMRHAADYLGVDYQIIYAFDRDGFELPYSYESHFFMSPEYLLYYFPDQRDWFDPNPARRLGPPPSNVIGTRALSIQYTAAGERLVDIIKIPPAPSKHSIDSIKSSLTINTTTLQATIQLDRSVSGYIADPYRAGIDALNEEEQREVKESFFTYVLTEAVQLGAYTFENDHATDFHSKSLVGHVTATSTALVSEANNKLLVNFGTLIGPQSNMYKEKPELRQLPVDLDYLHRYHRELRLTIPEGYTIANKEDLNLVVTPDSEDNSIGFTSSYTISDNELVVTVTEWYDTLSYPKEQYRYVVDVYNAAADFNKLVLVLEKQ